MSVDLKIWSRLILPVSRLLVFRPKTLPVAWVLVLLIVAIWSQLTWAQTLDRQTIDRSGFGQSSYPIWSPLSYFERDAISQRHAAMAGDPDALLALYILASGRYELSDYQDIKKRIDSFLNIFKDKAGDNLDDWKIGNLLNTKIHQSFFSSTNENTKESHGAISNYNLDQSAFAGIFKNNEFNCISSSMLYAVLLKRLGLTAQGAMLPSHAFIQLDLSDGRRVDVETTSPSGYDQHHDEEFYQRAASAWFNTRGLTPSTYDDYVNRELIPLWKLATRNMLNQHTHPGRMDPIDRGRLAEISAFIDPDYELAQNNRIHHYTSEASALAEANQWADIAKLVLAVMPQLDMDIPSFSHNQQLQNSHFWLYLMGVQAFAYQLDVTNFELFVDQTMLRAYSTERLHRAKSITLSSAEILLNEIIEQKDFNQGLDLLYTLEQYTADHPHYATLIAKLYQAWSKHYWNEERWPDAVAALEDYLLQPYLLDDLSTTHSNLSSAYKNWIIHEIKINNSAIVPAITLQCESQHALTNICAEARQLSSKTQTAKQ